MKKYKPLTEVYGEFGSGKTQIGHQLAVNAIRPLEEGGLNGEVFYIDTEDTFRPERIAQMAEAVGIVPGDALERIHVARAYNSAHQILLVDEIKRMAKNIYFVPIARKLGLESQSQEGYGLSILNGKSNGTYLNG